MFSRQIEQLARQRDAERPVAPPAAPAAAAGPGTAGHTLRNQTGWALVAIGLRLAGSGSH